MHGWSENVAGPGNTQRWSSSSHISTAKRIGPGDGISVVPVVESADIAVIGIQQVDHHCTVVKYVADPQILVNRIIPVFRGSIWTCNLYPHV